ncbi:MAG: nuclear transport factor 2 family protein [Novosphingobium sp.]
MIASLSRRIVVMHAKTRQSAASFDWRSGMEEGAGMTSHYTLSQRLAKLEAEAEIRRVTARYFQICDDLGPETPFEELGNLFSTDARWEGRGRYQAAFGSYDGRAAIVEMIRGYCLPVPHFAMTAHFFSAEHLIVNDDGCSARGQWLMLQTSTYADGRCDLRSAALTLIFTIEEDLWRIAHFRTRNLFSRRVDTWNDTAAIPVPKVES